MRALFVLVGTLACAACGRAGERERPNVLLISIDTLRADHLSLYGYPRDTSPFLARFAAGARVFERAYSPAPWTLIAHMSMLTGLYPPQHGVIDGELALAPEIPLLAERLSAAGWQTVGLHHPVWVVPRHGFARGFDVFRPHTDIAAAEEHLHEELARLDDARPTFLFVHLFDVHVGPVVEGQHSIYPSPAPFQEFFRPGASAELPLYLDQLDPHDPVQREALAALYDGGIRHVDHELERWFGWLEQRGFLENTLVIVTADHGENLMERGRNAGHGHFWNEGIQVPLVVRFPDGRGAGERVRELAHLADIVPTALEVCGLPRDESLAGRSLCDPLPAERVILGLTEGVDQPRAYVMRGTQKIARGMAGGYLASDLGLDPAEKHGVRLADGQLFDEWWRAAFDTGRAFPPAVPIEEELTPEQQAELSELGYGGALEDDAPQEPR
jgi:arylsulfatase A-like enzyme